jgi:hypothetical protein
MFYKEIVVFWFNRERFNQRNEVSDEIYYYYYLYEKTDLSFQMQRCWYLMEIRLSSAFTSHALSSYEASYMIDRLDFR